jgi:hypothetical protein
MGGPPGTTAPGLQSYFSILHMPLFIKADSSLANENKEVIARSQAAAKLMDEELRAEHKRWNLPLISWKNGMVVATKL